VLGNELLFVRGNTSSPDLWKTDGTVAGTLLLGGSGLGAWPRIHVTAGGKAYISSGFRPIHVVTTSGGVATGVSEASTVVEIPLEYAGAANAAVIGENLVFAGSATGDSTSADLWITDGTAQGTHPVRGPVAIGAGVGEYSLTGDFGFVQMAPGSGDSDLLMVLSGMEVWHSDGSQNGTKKQVSAQGTYGYGAVAALPGASFASIIGPGDTTEVWTANNTGTWRRLSSIAPSMPPYGSILRATSKDVFIYAYSDPFGMELWRTDGTSAGTRRLVAEHVVSFISDPFVIKDVFYFFGSDERLWRSDGTALGTYAIADGLYAPNWDVYGASASNEIARNVAAEDGESFYLLAVNLSGGNEIWKSDGTRQGTFRVAPFDASVWQVPSIAVTRGKAFFCGWGQGFVDGLWVSDGTANGTRLFSTSTGLFEPAGFVAYQGRVYFSAMTEATGRELWSTDGTPAGTRLVKDIAPGVLHSMPGPLTEWQGKLYFCAWDPEHGAELWVTDGTSGGTRLVSDMVPGIEGSVPMRLTATKDKLYFLAFDYESGMELRVLKGGSGSGGDGGCSVAPAGRRAGILFGLLLALVAAARFRARLVGEA
jgi:ELWxxDGT repeat protein